MPVEHPIQTMPSDRPAAIAANSAFTTTQDFLNSLPPEVSQVLPPGYLQSLEEELQAELHSLVFSRLQWFQQAIRLEQQQHQSVPAFLISNSDPEPIFQSEFLYKPSASSDLLAELKSGAEPLPITSAAEQPYRKRVLVHNPDAQDQMSGPTSESLDLDSGSVPFRNSQSEPPKADEAQTSRPSLRHRGKEPQPTHEVVLESYGLKPQDLRLHDPEAKLRRRRRRSAAMV